MSVELLDLIKNYRIVCYDDDYVYKLLKNNWDLFSYLNTDLTKGLGNDQAIEILLNDADFISNLLLNRKRDKALFFYMNRKIDMLLKDLGVSMLLPHYDTQERLGNKLYLSGICKKLGLSPNKSLNFKVIPNDLDGVYTKCRETLGLPFIIQGALGVSGEDTFLVDQEKDMNKAMANINGEFRATRYIKKNIPISVHVCILASEIIVRGPFIQLLGFPELSSNPFQFTGNDTNQSLFNQSFVNKVRDLSLRIGEYAKTEGYMGILGIDYLWDKGNGAIYPQELNTRLIGLTRLLTGVQKDQLIFPDLLRHIEEFDTPDYSDKCNGLYRKDIDLSRHDYSQVIICNNLSGDVTVSNYITPGIYRLADNALYMVKPSLFVCDMEDHDILITQSVHKNQILRPGGIISRVIFKRSAINNGTYGLDSTIIRIISLIRGMSTNTYAQS